MKDENNCIECRNKDEIIRRFQNYTNEKNKQIAELEKRVKFWEDKAYNISSEASKQAEDMRNENSALKKQISTLKKENEELKESLVFEKQNYEELSAKLKIKFPEAVHSLDVHKGHFFTGCKGCEYEIGNLIDQKLANRDKEWVEKIETIGEGEYDQTLAFNLTLNEWKKVRSEMGVKG